MAQPWGLIIILLMRKCQRPVIRSSQASRNLSTEAAVLRSSRTSITLTDNQTTNRNLLPVLFCEKTAQSFSNEAISDIIPSLTV